MMIPSLGSRLSDTSVWRNRDFVRLWTGQSVSQVASELAEFAFPLVAVITLVATPLEVGVVGTARFLPFLLITLFAGVWIDRRTRRPVMIWANGGRALLLLAVPALHAVGLLTIPTLVVVAFLVGCMTVLFDLAYYSYVPSVVGRDRLDSANGALEASASTAELAGPAAGGVITQVLSAPLTMLVAAVSYGSSALALLRIKREEVVEERPPTSVLSDIREGMHFVVRNAYLRALALQAMIWNLFNNAFLVAVTLYIVRQLDYGPAFLGVMFSVASAGGLLGAVLATRVTRLLGFGPGLILAVAIDSLAPVGIPLASGPELFMQGAFLVASFLWGVGIVISNVNVISLRQGVTPDHLLARSTGSIRLFSWGGIPLGSMLGGLLSSVLDFRVAVLISALGLSLSLIPLLASPIPRLKRNPAGSGEQDAPAEGQ